MSCGPTRPSSSGAARPTQIADGLTLIRTGGHFPGSTVLHWAAGAAGRGALLTGDSIMVVPDTRWVSFMYSYPNLIPLNARAVTDIVSAVDAFAFDRLYAGWWDRVRRARRQNRRADARPSATSRRSR